VRASLEQIFSLLISDKNNIVYTIFFL